MFTLYCMWLAFVLGIFCTYVILVNCFHNCISNNKYILEGCSDLCLHGLIRILYYNLVVDNYYYYLWEFLYVLTSVYHSCFAKGRWSDIMVGCFTWNKLLFLNEGLWCTFLKLIWVTYIKRNVFCFQTK